MSLDNIWEDNNGIDSSTFDAHFDADDDGWTNREEYLKGTDPHDSLSNPKDTSMYIRISMNDYTNTNVLQYDTANINWTIYTNGGAPRLWLNITNKTGDFVLDITGLSPYFEYTNKFMYRYA